MPTTVTRLWKRQPCLVRTAVAVVAGGRRVHWYKDWVLRRDSNLMVLDMAEACRNKRSGAS